MKDHTDVPIFQSRVYVGAISSESQSQIPDLAQAARSIPSENSAKMLRYGGNYGKHQFDKGN